MTGKPNTAPRLTPQEYQLLGAFLQSLDPPKREMLESDRSKFAFKRSRDHDNSVHAPYFKRLKTWVPPTLAKSAAAPLGKGLMDLPRELRDRIWELALARGRKLEPISTSEAAPIRQKARMFPPLFNGMAISRRDHLVYHNFGLVDISLLTMNEQVHIEATEALVRSNTISFTAAPNFDYHIDSHMRKRFKHILEHAPYIHIEVDDFSSEAWWLSVLQAKTNLRYLDFIIRHGIGSLSSPGVFLIKSFVCRDEVENALRALRKIKASEESRMLYCWRDIFEVFEIEPEAMES